MIDNTKHPAPSMIEVKKLSSHFSVANLGMGSKHTLQIYSVSTEQASTAKFRSIQPSTAKYSQVQSSTAH